MPWFLCEYRQDGTKFGSDIWANSWSHARRLATIRGAGETVIGQGGKKRPFYPFPSELLRRRSMTKQQALDAVHGCTFLGFLALKSGRANVDEVLGDRGFVHETIHAVQFGRASQGLSVGRREYAEVIKCWEFKIPGFRNPRDL